MGKRVERVLQIAPVDPSVLEEHARLESPDGPEVPLPERCERGVENISDERQQSDGVDREMQPIGGVWGGRRLRGGRRVGSRATLEASAMAETRIRPPMV